MSAASNYPTSTTRVHRITPAEAIANAADDQKIWNAIFGYNE
jgi:hypothetical protein